MAYKNGLSYQRRILKAVQDRGYVDGWKIETFIARQVVKLLEEVCELYLAFPWQSPTTLHLRDLVQVVQHSASRIFDDEGDWHPEPYQSLDAMHFDSMLDESADCVVVLSCLAEMAGELRGARINLLEIALDKAEGDVERGRRKP